MGTRLDLETEHDLFLQRVNSEATQSFSSIEAALKRKITTELNELGVEFLFLKLHLAFDIFKECDCYFTGLFKYNGEQYEVVKGNKDNYVAILNKKGKKGFSNLYKVKCCELKEIGEILFFDKVNKILEREKKKVANKTEIC